MEKMTYPQPNYRIFCHLCILMMQIQEPTSQEQNQSKSIFGFTKELSQIMTLEIYHFKFKKIIQIAVFIQNLFLLL